MQYESVWAATSGAQGRVRVAAVEAVASRVAVAEVGAMKQFAGAQDLGIAIRRSTTPPTFRTQAVDNNGHDNLQQLL